MTCFECEGTPVCQMTEMTGERAGEPITVRIEAWVCPACGFKTLDSSKISEFALLVSDAYRAKHGLLTSSEIKECRHRLQMSQEQFASYLGVGSASVKRWEAGQVQDKAMNELMRLKTDLVAAKANVDEVRSRQNLPVTGTGAKGQAIVWRCETLPIETLHAQHAPTLWELFDIATPAVGRRTFAVVEPNPEGRAIIKSNLYSA